MPRGTRARNGRRGPGSEPRGEANAIWNPEHAHRRLCRHGGRGVHAACTGRRGARHDDARHDDGRAAAAVVGAEAGAATHASRGGPLDAARSVASTFARHLDPHARAKPSAPKPSSAEQRRARVTAVHGTGWSVVHVRAGSRAATQRALEADPDVAAVEPNLIRHALAAPTDPGWSTQSAYLRPLRLERAWEQAGRGAGEIVAVVDTGVDLDHPDLVGRLLPGHDFVNHDPHPQDDAGHGTMVAGIIAADANNGRGVTGVAGSASILPVKVLDSSGSGDDATIANGITWATDHGADVINLSLGGPGDSATLDGTRSRTRKLTTWRSSRQRATTAPASRAFPPRSPGCSRSERPETTARPRTSPLEAGGSTSPRLVSASFRLRSARRRRTTSGAGPRSPPRSSRESSHSKRHLFPGRNESSAINAVIASARDRGPWGIDEFEGHGTVDALGAVGGPLPAPHPAFTQDASEPNDTLARATLHAATTPWSDTISPEGDEDWSAVDLTTGTWNVRVTPTAATDPLDPRALDAVVEVYWPANTLVGYADNTFENGVENATFLAAAPGRYRVRVRNYVQLDESRPLHRERRAVVRPPRAAADPCGRRRHEPGHANERACG